MRLTMAVKFQVFVGEGRKMHISAKKGAALSFLLLFSLLFFTHFASAQYSHRNVTTIVNVTNAAPEILNITIDNPIILNAGGDKEIACNVTIRDYNGHNDVINVNSTFYYFLNESSDSDDKNEHYTNTNCSRISDDGFFTVNYSCAMNISYIAYNGTWFCNVSMHDEMNFTADAEVATNISALYALNVTDIIDYGNLAVTDYSDNITATVTNFGNTDINISVLGYGAVEGDGLGFVCNQGTNISVQFQRYSIDSTAAYGAKKSLNASNTDINTTLLRQTDDTTPVTRNTYWQLYVPPNPFGVCTGVVRFTATVP
jgi:hypothetical protein